MDDKIRSGSDQEKSPDASLHWGFSVWLLDLGSNQGPTD